MVTLPVLQLPDFSLTFDVTTDASQVAVGAVLSQNQRPIAFFSKKLSPSMQSTSAYEREMYAITEAVWKWRHYLLGRRFHIYTDQKSLRGLLQQTIQTPAQHKWLTKLLAFDYDIFYTPGKSNFIADSLSRYSAPAVFLLSAVSSAAPIILTQLREFYASHPAGVSIIRHLHATPSNPLVLSPQHSLVYYRDRIFIPEQIGLRTQLLTEFHSTTIGGH
ncbi:UNVERIFIED_CONTAM: Retrovirus-related Pol polyprotein from transposon.6 [Sesamum radiatum]|uniref:Retrovirus-related Pol polyprotein from transposon.6 n=1 Tax=Sesamum radiatum TaxID=300843 RepID=A0AAW2PFY5_SESRA